LRAANECDVFPSILLLATSLVWWRANGNRWGWPLVRSGGSSVPGQSRLAVFVRIFEPHLDAAYGFARWLLGNDHDAEGSTQDAYVQAFRHFDRFGGTNPRVWLLAIVRNCCHTTLRRSQSDAAGTVNFVGDEYWRVAANVSFIHAHRIERAEPATLPHDDARLLDAAIEALPIEQREAFALREVGGLSYEEIAEIVGIPLRMVRSRLCSARAQLQQALHIADAVP
jgi:RNA polymerase sigma factor (sigma-70 family)